MPDVPTPDVAEAVWAAAAELPQQPQARDLAALRRRYPSLSAEAWRIVIDQTLLRRRAARRFGDPAARMWWTAAGLEQASRPIVAAWRAQRLASVGSERVVDLGCGLGLDAVGFARSGRPVLGVEIDERTAEYARRNLAVLAPASDAAATVIVADAMTHPVASSDLLFCDPARRSGTTADGRSRRRIDPQLWQPPWSTIGELGQRHPALAVKAAPGLPHDVIPAGVSATWVSVAGDLVETFLQWPGAGGAGLRAAVVLADSLDPWDPPQSRELSGAPEPAAVAPLGAVVVEPDPAIIRSGLVGILAAAHGLGVVSHGIAYCTGAHPVPRYWGRSFRVVEVLPARPKQLRAALLTRGVGSLEIRTRGLDLDPAALRSRLRLPRQGSPASVILTRLAGDAAAILVEPVQPQR